MTQRHFPGSKLATRSNDDDDDEDLFEYFYDEPGSLPGTLSIDEDACPSFIVLIDYNESHANRVTNLTADACTPYLTSDSVSWLDIQGLGSEDILLAWGELWGYIPCYWRMWLMFRSAPKWRITATSY